MTGTMVEVKRSSWAWLPNVLTLARFPLALFAAYAFWVATTDLAAMAEAQAQGARLDGLVHGVAGVFWAIWGAAAFGVAAAFDFLDGWLARALKAQSAFGALLDPIADKFLVLVCLAAIVLSPALSGPAHVIALASALIILARDVTITALRIRGVQAPVSRLAKWKTAVEMAVIGALYGLLLLNQVATYQLAWAIGLAGAAAFSVWTGAGYLRAGLRAT